MSLRLGDRKRTRLGAWGPLFPSAVRSGPAGWLLAWRTGETEPPSQRRAHEAMARVNAKVRRQLEGRRLL